MNLFAILINSLFIVTVEFLKHTKTDKYLHIPLYITHMRNNVQDKLTYYFIVILSKRNRENTAKSIADTESCKTQKSEKLHWNSSLRVHNITKTIMRRFLKSGTSCVKVMVIQIQKDLVSITILSIRKVSLYCVILKSLELRGKT